MSMFGVNKKQGNTWRIALLHNMQQTGHTITAMAGQEERLLVLGTE